MKHLTLLLSSVAMTAVAAQHPHHLNKAPFTGFGVIAQAGGIAGEADLRQQTAGAMPPSYPIGYTNDTRISQTGAAGTIGMGYAHQFHTGVVLGGVFTAGFNYLTFESTAQTDSTTNTRSQFIQGTLTTKLRNDFALLLKPGFAFGDTLVYGLIGPRWGNFDSNVHNELTATLSGATPPTVTLPAQANQTAYHVGLAVGVGLSQRLWPHVLAGVEYQYTAYSNSIASFRTTNDTTEPPYTGTGYIAHDSVEGITTNTLMATLTYQF